ncbi:MAG: hypothetical protein AAF222_09555 [Pseudomonadota bacterium]
MRKPISFEQIEEYFEQASPEAVAQRVRRLIAVIIPFLKLEDEMLNSIAGLTEWSQPNAEQLQEFTRKYAKREESVQSYWLATAMIYTEGLIAPTNDDYDEEVFFISSCLKHLGCSTQLYYQTLFYDLLAHEIREMYS